MNDLQQEQLNAEERRKLVEAPLPIVHVWPNKSHGGTNVERKRGIPVADGVEPDHDARKGRNR